MDNQRMPKSGNDDLRVTVLVTLDALQVGIVSLAGLFFRDFGVWVGWGDPGGEGDGVGGGILREGRCCKSEKEGGCQENSANPCPQVRGT